jgi:hypothetical protein
MRPVDIKKPVNKAGVLEHPAGLPAIKGFVVQV